MKKQHEQWMNQYLHNCKQLNKSELTIKNYKSDIIKFIKWHELTTKQLITKTLGNEITDYKNFLSAGGILKKKISKRKKIINKISKLINLFLFNKNNPTPITHSIELVQSPLSVTSRRRNLSSIKNFFEFLKQTHEDNSKFFLINPVKSKLHAIKLKDTDVVNTKMINHLQWENVYNSAYNASEKLIIYLLYWGGLRLSEITNLTVNNFLTDSKMLTFARKGGYIHTLDIINPKIIFEQFHIIQSSNPELVYLFSKNNRRPISTRSMYKKIMKILSRANCPRSITPHSFRKACATNLYLKSKDLLYVRDYLNHNDAKITQTYIDKSTLKSYQLLLKDDKYNSNKTILETTC
jgi:integrase/recombinase XerD